MRIITYILALCLFFSCRTSEHKPDVSNIKIELSCKRFEKDFFSLDTNQMEKGIQGLYALYPSFAENYFSTILNTNPSWGRDTASSYIKGFIKAYRKLYDTSQLIFADFSSYEKEIKKTLQYLKYYFPTYHAPANIITYIGPLDGYGDIITEDAFIIALHHHLGSGASFYNNSWLLQTYPSYLTARFEPSYIAINCMKNVLSDMFPDIKQDATLSTQMIEQGKRMYLLEKLLPDAAAFQLIGYTEKQMKDCYAHESEIWNLFIQNNLLQTLDKNLIKNYIGESPKTQELGEGAPGNIGTFAGWQIVKKYISKMPDATLEQLMKTDDELIIETAKYKP